MKFRALTVILLTGLLWVASWLITPPAFALIQIQLSDLSYRECPQEYAQGNVTSGGNSLPASCYLVTGKAKNPTGNTLYDADVFGRIYDANNNPVLQNRTRVGSIAELPPGVSGFEIRITVASNQPTPLKLKQFKASAFSGKVRPYYYQDQDDFADFTND